MSIYDMSDPENFSGEEDFIRHYGLPNSQPSGSGEGRMTEPDAILARLHGDLVGQSKFNGKRILVTAGPTEEAIDPVRFIGNRSSGKMGFALAEEAALRGAMVELVSGPVDLELARPTSKPSDGQLCLQKNTLNCARHTQPSATSATSWT